MDAYKLAFEKKYPEVEVNVYRAISGEVLTKLKTEKEAQQGSVDVVWVADFSSANSLKELDLLAKYDSAEGAAIDPAFKDSEGYYYGSRIINMVLQYRHSGARFLEGSSLARVFRPGRPARRQQRLRIPVHRCIGRERRLRLGLFP